MKLNTKTMNCVSFLYLAFVVPVGTLYAWDAAASGLSRPDDVDNACAVLLYIFLAIHNLWALKVCLFPAIAFLKGFRPVNKTLPLFALLSLVLFGCTKVEPGYVGIKVNQYGTQKGVEDFPLQTGRVMFNPFTTDVYKFPTFRQNRVWTKDNTEGSPGDDSITFNSIEGSVLNADVAISYSIKAEKVPLVFVTFRQDIDSITHVYVRSELRDAISRHAGAMKVIDIFGAKKQELLDAVKKDLNANLGAVGFEFEMVSFVGGLRCDPNVMRSISATIEATQVAISAQNKVLQAKAEADQALETARGKAGAILIEAESQAKANKLVSESLTPELVRWKSIEKWDGVQPRVFAGDKAGLLLQVP